MEKQPKTLYHGSNRRIEGSLQPIMIKGMMECGTQVYFINDDPIFDKIVADKKHRAPILRALISENQKDNLNIKIFNS